MVNKSKVISATIIAILFVSAISGTVFYYNGVVNDRDSKIALLNNQIAKLSNQISNLTSQITNLTSANLMTALGIKEETSVPNNHLWMTGWVFNKGLGTAYNAGLHVVAYDAKGTLEVNMTVPLVDGMGEVFYTFDIIPRDSQINTLQFGSLDAGQNATITLSIFHEGLVTNWTVTPVWTNSP
jgi:hypothetical protein